MTKTCLRLLFFIYYFDFFHVVVRVKQVREYRLCRARTFSVSQNACISAMREGSPRLNASSQSSVLLHHIVAAALKRFNIQQLVLLLIYQYSVVINEFKSFHFFYFLLNKSFLFVLSSLCFYPFSLYLYL